MTPEYHEEHGADPALRGATELTHLLVVDDVERSKAFYTEVLGAELVREYGGNSVVLRFLRTTAAACR